MLKKINVADARLGMYIHKICGDWMNHPFWKNAFLLSDQKDLEKLKNCGLTELWIDTAKGMDLLNTETCKH